MPIPRRHEQHEHTYVGYTPGMRSTSTALGVLTEIHWHSSATWRSAAQLLVLGIDKYFDGIRHLKHLDISYLVISHAMGYDMTIDISCDRYHTGSSRNTKHETNKTLVG